MNSQDLKNSILQLAIQGKLVEQREEEGTAKELLEHIKVEKEQLIEEKKIRKEKPLTEINEDEIPFDIPENWEWVRLGNIFKIIMGQSPKGASVFESNDGIEFHQGKVFFGNDYLQRSNQSTNKPTKIVEPNTVLLCVRAPVGIVNITERKICIGRGLCGINTFADMDEKFVLYTLRAFKNDFIKKATGTTFVAITGEVVKNQLVPLPPLEEQKRIVAKIEELLPYVEEYDKAYRELEELNKRFPEDMQKSILQYATQGKLVEQCEEEGNAEELYQQIQEEKEKLVKVGKIKKSKKLPEIKEDDIPFDIPETWKWVRFSDLATFLNGDRGKNYPNKNEYVNEGVPWINTGHITKDGYLTTKTMNYITEEKYESLSGGKIQFGDLVYCLRGATFGKTARIEPYEKGAVASSLMIIRLADLRIREYIFLYLRSPIAFNQLRQYDNGSAQPNLAAKDVAKYLIPLPPLEEQRRIVAKVEELLPYRQQLVK
ncbi:restriction endonuclease subunit S [Bacillus paralicheniformis]|uniref:restriction endonuclease subunit S n=1 Tax=Bacillus paralicheniformis TaxID=1648923 RepID=UPI0003423AA3|nr:restriction endonuclease subunit S [Bacillus paralicheniformis]KUL08795.1 type I restriction endonuclease EcoAI subunit S [Bacillus licheniformis LMG 7559]AGN35408.1 type I restriction-modification system specificity subunit HsdS [Bacillus paralicheniformis ATCC 9945a]AYQ15503.1 restriction endonuclease subunit S [Bacillus paralicheniformis]MCR3891221.1 restriction endonuclease subunit S [Bacillus paralicheniformis]MCV9370365.1 restriction endonuclease subunit S [Bacillus paralicheniformis]